MLKLLWSCTQNIMTAKKRYIVFGFCVILILVLVAVNVWSVHIHNNKIIGFSSLSGDEKMVVFHNYFTITNISIFPKEVTVEVYSYRDAAIGDGENSYITAPELKVESIEKLRVVSNGIQSDERTILGNPFTMEPLSSYTIVVCSTGEYGGYGHAERHPADTVKLSSKFAIEK